MADHPPVLVAPDAFGGELRAPVVAAAIGRGLERAGITPPPELCPVAGGGRGTLEVLLLALGGETGDGFALIEDGGTAIVEYDGSSEEQTGERLAVAARSGAQVVLLAAGPAPGAGRRGAAAGTALPAGPTPSTGRRSAADGAAARGHGDSLDGHGHGAMLLAALDDHGGLAGAALVVLCDVRNPDPLAERLRDECGARLVAGVPFILDALDFDARMRAARAVIVGERRLERATLMGRVAGEIATRARQSGVPCHAVAAERAIDRFDQRILDLQAVVEAGSIAELEAAGEELAHEL
ncbi:MAG: glycerate kinase [Solirubrobacteraceae bacterium]|nr:glycerate kinase [Solirubrobacteraceae bacterium]